MSGIIGAESLHETSYDNGLRIAAAGFLCHVPNDSWGNFVSAQGHPQRHLEVSRWPNCQYQIDHVCISTKWSHSLLDVRSYRGADIGSDHYLVKSPMRIKLMSNGKAQSSSRRFPAIENLHDHSKVEEYCIALQNRLSSLPVEENLDEEWGQVRETIKEVSMEVLGERPRRRKQQHLSHC